MSLHVTNEERNFCQDLCHRTRKVAFSIDRLHDLTETHYVLADARDKARDEKGVYHFTAEMLQAEASWDAEVELLTSYICYELKSVVAMLLQWDVRPIRDSELEYVLKVRDRFLSHPEYLRVSPRANRGKSIPYKTGFTQCDLIGLQQWDPITQATYLAQLGLQEPIERQKEVERNSEIIRSRTLNENLSEEEVTRIKAFGVREPDLETGLKEFANLLNSFVLEKIKSIYNQATSRLGFERDPA